VTLDARRARVLGSAIGIAVFVVPMGLVILSLWLHEPGADGEQTGVGRPASAARPAGRIRGVSRSSQPPGARGLTRDAPIAVGLRRVSTAEVEVTLRNVSGRRLRLVVPGGPGRVVRMVPRDAAPALPRWPVYDPDHDAVVELLPGASYTCVIRDKKEFPPGPFRAVYDSRGKGRPATAWSGRAESNVVR
jgi:hypothetical protein